MVFFRGPDEVQQAETASKWPRECVVCAKERGIQHISYSDEGAVAHRKKEHPWIEEIIANFESWVPK